MCMGLAKDGYDEDLGARSLISAMKSVIEVRLVGSYLDVNEEIREDQQVMEYVVNIRRGEVGVKVVHKDVGNQVSLSG